MPPRRLTSPASLKGATDGTRFARPPASSLPRSPRLRAFAVRYGRRASRAADIRIPSRAEPWKRSPLRCGRKIEDPFEMLRLPRSCLRSWWVRTASRQQFRRDTTEDLKIQLRTASAASRSRLLGGAFRAVLWGWRYTVKPRWLGFPFRPKKHEHLDHAQSSARRHSDQPRRRAYPRIAWRQSQLRGSAGETRAPRDKRRQ